MSFCERLIDDWHKWWRFWSLRLTAVGVALQSWITIAPDSLTSIWASAPTELREILPLWLLKAIPIGLFMTSMLARLMKQGKLNA